MRRLVGLLVALGLAVVGLITAPSASGATLTVNNLSDSGPGSLRQALLEASTSSEADTVNVTVSGTITLTSGPLTYAGTSPLIINGNGVTVTAASLPDLLPSGRPPRVLDFTDANGDISISRMILTGGRARTVLTSDPCNNFIRGEGGGISTRGALTLTDVTVTGNSALHQSITYVPCPPPGSPLPPAVTQSVGGNGGGIDATRGITLVNSIITNNTASRHGGGLYTVDTVNSVGSTVSGNTAGDSGAGIYSTFNASLVRTSLSGNVAGVIGGALFASCDVNLAETTVNGNTANGNAAGVYGTGGTIRNSTITANVVGPAGTLGGAGIRVVPAPQDLGRCPAAGKMNVEFSTIAGNTAAIGGANVEGDSGVNWTFVGTVISSPLGGGSNCSFGGTVTATYSYSWGSNAASCGFGGGTNTTSEAAGDNPGLGPLANNGGPTQTMMPGAPLQGRVPAASCTVNRDQRSRIRPFDAFCDIGAVEDISGETPLPGVSPTGVCSEFNPINPVRVLDTRSDTSRAVDGGGAGIGPGRVGQGQTISVNVTNVPGNGDGGVPQLGVRAVALNVTATESSAPSFVTVWPTGSARPTASNLNTEVGTDVPNATIAQVGSNGLVSLFNNSGNVHLIVDVVGWFATCGRFQAIVPHRVLDTRNGTGVPAGVVPAAGSISVTVTGVGGAAGVPALNVLKVTAVVLNVTSTESSLPSFVTVWPTGEPPPLASSLNTEPGQDVPNLVIAKVGIGGQVSLYNNSGNTHLVADILGYFPFDSVFQPLNPRRVLDTREGIGAPGPVPGQQSRNLTVVGGDVPANASAVVVNVTTTESTLPSFVTVWPTGSPRPVASSLNTEPRVDVPNLVFAKVGVNGQISLFNNNGNVHLVGDILGFFQPPPA